MKLPHWSIIIAIVLWTFAVAFLTWAVTEEGACERFGGKMVNNGECVDLRPLEYCINGGKPITDYGVDFNFTNTT